MSRASEGRPTMKVTTGYAFNDTDKVHVQGDRFRVEDDRSGLVFDVVSVDTRHGSAVEFHFVDGYPMIQPGATNVFYVYLRD